MSKSITELLTAFYVHEYVNKLRQSAVTAHSKKEYETVIDAYKNLVINYTRALCGDLHHGIDGKSLIWYNKSIEKFYKDIYCEHINDEDKFLTFIDRTTVEFLPKQFYEALGQNYAKKEVIVREILRLVIKDFSHYVINNKIKDIFNPKNKEELISDLKDFFAQTLEKKQNIYIMNTTIPRVENQSDIMTIAQLRKDIMIVKKDRDDVKKKNELITAKYRELAAKHNLLIKERNGFLMKLKAASVMTNMPTHTAFIRPADEHTPSPSPPNTIKIVELSSGNTLDSDDDFGGRLCSDD